MNFLKRIFARFVSAQGAAPGGGWVVTVDGAKVWDDDPRPGETVTWSGDSNAGGYACGPGVLQFMRNGEPKVSFEGQMRRGKFHGRGVFTFANGDRYEGEFVNGKRTGKGILKYADGEFYQGRFLNNEFHGKGKYLWADGDWYEGHFVQGRRTGKGVFRWAESGNYYEGDFVDNERSGKGRYKWADGDCYEGDFVNGQRTGRGMLRWADGSYYEGDFADNARSGKGIYKWADGDVYEGDFVADVRTGKGLFVFADGESFAGELRNDEFVKGLYKWTNGDRYEGEFAANKLHGKGVFRYGDGSYYAGDFVDGDFHGQGEMCKRTSGEVYKGDFARDRYHGRGVLQFADGSCYEGDFAEGEFHGKGIFRYADGSCFEGAFAKGGPAGAGIYRDAEGRRFEGQYVDGEMYGYGILYGTDGALLQKGWWENGACLAAGELTEEILGARGQTIPLPDAVDKYQLRKVFPYRLSAYKKSAPQIVRVIEGDICLSDNLDLRRLYALHGIAGVIVQGNLRINGSLSDFSRRDAAAFLLVTGDLRAENIIAGRALIGIWGNAFVDKVMIAHAGSGSIKIKGDLQGQLLIVCDHLLQISGKQKAATLATDRSKAYVRQDYRDWQAVLTPDAAKKLLDGAGTIKNDKEVLDLILQAAPIFRPGLQAKLTGAAVGGDVKKGRFIPWSQVQLYMRQIKERFAVDLWGYRKDEELAEEVFLFYEGDTVFDGLDLDAREFAVIVAGNLTVRGNITNENTDGATSLIVLGSLQAENIAVGGQTVCVTGHLTAAEIICGSYNHGDMLVGGDVRARLILADDYHFQIGGEVAGQFIDVWEKSGFAQLEELLASKVFDADEDGLMFSFAALQAELAAGRTVLRETKATGGGEGDKRRGVSGKTAAYAGTAP